MIGKRRKVGPRLEDRRMKTGVRGEGEKMKIGKKEKLVKLGKLK